MKKTSKFIACAAAVIAAYMLSADAVGVSEAVKKASESCLSVIIPSLFGFMVLSSCIISSGLYRFLFGLPYFIFGKAAGFELYPFSVFAVSMLGGYPVGARLISDMAEDKRNLPLCEDMLCYCYCPSPPFAITVVGLGVFGSSTTGLVIYLSNVISCAVAALFINKISRNVFYKCEKNTVTKKNNIILFSVNSTASALMKICSMILLFAVITELAGFLGIHDALSAVGGDISTTIFSSALEISTIGTLSEFSASCPALLPVASALTSLGGLCILFQTASLTSGKIRMKKFLLARIPIAAVSAAATFILSKTIPDAVTVGAKTVQNIQISSVKPLASAFLIVMCAILLKNCKKNSKKGSNF